jgi:hypothetical protein
MNLKHHFAVLCLGLALFTRQFAADSTGYGELEEEWRGGIINGEKHIFVSDGRPSLMLERHCRDSAAQLEAQGVCGTRIPVR